MADTTSFHILQNTTESDKKHPHESFLNAKPLGARLRSAITGEVRFDAGSRALYATDASNYRQFRSVLSFRATQTM
jgi:hypothetical protein